MAVVLLCSAGRPRACWPRATFSLSLSSSFSSLRPLVAFCPSEFQSFSRLVFSCGLKG